MRGVKAPFVINMFYFCDPDGHGPYVQCRDAMPVDEYTPKLGSLTMADASLEILKRTVETVPCVEVEGIRQKYQVIITNWEEPEIIGMNKTPGMSSGEVFKPIFQSLDKPGRANQNMNREDRYF